MTFPQTLTVSENYNLGRYGEMVLSNGRLFNPTNITTLGAAANAQQAAKSGDDSAFATGDLDYTTLLSAGDMLSLFFDVIVQAAPLGEILENVAWITIFTDPLDIANSTLAVIATNLTQTQVVPEPGTLVLFGIGIVGIFALIRLLCPEGGGGILIISKTKNQLRGVQIV